MMRMKNITISTINIISFFHQKRMGWFLGKIQAEIKTSFGKIIVEGLTASDLLDTLKSLPENFVNEIEAVVSEMVMPDKDNIEYNDIVKFTDVGPVLILKDTKRITHYEAVGLILYFSENRSSRPSQIRRLLEYSGLRVQVSSRLNEMAKRGLVFRPTLEKPEWTLSPKGEFWIEEEVIPKLRRPH